MVPDTRPTYWLRRGLPLSYWSIVTLTRVWAGSSHKVVWTHARRGPRSSTRPRSGGHRNRWADGLQRQLDGGTGLVVGGEVDRRRVGPQEGHGDPNDHGNDRAQGRTSYGDPGGTTHGLFFPSAGELAGLFCLDGPNALG